MTKIPKVLSRKKIKEQENKSKLLNYKEQILILVVFRRIFKIETTERINEFLVLPTS
jgi:hypothetical protein